MAQVRYSLVSSTHTYKHTTDTHHRYTTYKQQIHRDTQATQHRHTDERRTDGVTEGGGGVTGGAGAGAGVKTGATLSVMSCCGGAMQCAVQERVSVKLVRV